MVQALIPVLYNLALLALLVLGSPWWLFLLLTSGKFREGLGERFFGVRSAASLSAKPRIWVHAVSVGEVLAVSGLVRELAAQATEYEIVVSTTTRTGQRLARERFASGPNPLARCFYFPLDFSWAVAATLARIAPAMLVLAESELWPNVLAACQRRGIPVVVVNARISDRSLPRYLRLRPLWRPFLRMLSLLLAQTEEDAERLRRIGVPPERVRVGGNLKFEVRPPKDAALGPLLRTHLPSGAVLLVCGSTLENEEAQLLAAWPEIARSVPDSVMLLAPRHPERFAAVASLLAASALPWVRRSEWAEAPRTIAPGSIFLLDSIGELAALYALARVAFVGGSLVPAGGHNPLEPAQFGVAIAMGPHTENFRAIAGLLLSSNAMVTVQPGDLAWQLSRLLTDEAANAELGRNARLVCERQIGATARCTAAILDLLQGGRA